MFKKQQYIIFIIATLILISVFGLSRMMRFEKNKITMSSIQQNQHEHLSIDTIIQLVKHKLSPKQNEYISTLTQQLNTTTNDAIKRQHLKNIIAFWQDTFSFSLAYYFYFLQQSILDKNTADIKTASYFFYDNLKMVKDPHLKDWFVDNVKKGLEACNIVENNSNDSTIITLAALDVLYVNNSNVMASVAKIKNIADKNPDNVYAQETLGIAAFISQQWQKCIDRLEKIQNKKAENTEIIIYLAESYANLKLYQKAKMYYAVLLKKTKDKEMRKMIQDKMYSLQ